MKGFSDIMTSGINGMSQVIQIPLNNDAEQIDWQTVGEEIPVLPLKNDALLPNSVLPIQASRPTSAAMLKAAFDSKTYFAVMTQSDPSINNPKVEDLMEYGTLSKAVRVMEMPDGSVSALVIGVARIRITAPGTYNDPENHYLTIHYQPCQDEYPDKDDKEFQAIISSIKDTAKRIFAKFGAQAEAMFAFTNIESPALMMSLIAAHTEISGRDKAGLLTIDSVKERASRFLALLSEEEQKVNLQVDVAQRVKQKLDKEQRDYIINQQIKTLQKELGNDPSSAIIDVEERAKTKDWPEHAKAAFEKELKRLKTLNPQSPDFATELNYVQTLLDLPWNTCTDDDFTIAAARKTLDDDHYGLEKVKERILEYLAVLKLKNNLKSPILCLYGPPGVGKTSLGKSIAKALNRKYVRVSLGGLHDEAEIRGHRRTYIGAMPGRIILNIKKAGASNPVFVLDEIDKIDSSFRGDPASAMLEVLDPEQNAEFHDNFLDLDYDLSKVMFIATANNITKISDALLDRMELIEVSGYVTEEKIEIARRHLIPKILADHGLKSEDLIVPDDTLKLLIDSYTRESGVRELSNVLSSLARKTAVKVASDEPYSPTITPDDVRKALGIPKYNHDEYFETHQPGVIPGLAWTSAGGELLYIEALLSNGTGTLNITGNLGKVMKESAEIAINYLCANEDALGISHRMFKEFDLSLHFPEGAVPKDGPSAGITIFTALASLYTQRPVRPHIAMTGELTLTGRVLAVGGIKEKILGAKRAGIKHIFMSEQNRRDIEEINPLYIEGLEFHYVKTAMELIPLVLEDKQVEKPIKPKARVSKKKGDDKGNA